MNTKGRLITNMKLAFDEMLFDRNTVDLSEEEVNTLIECDCLCEKIMYNDYEENPGTFLDTPQSDNDRKNDLIYLLSSIINNYDKWC